MLFFPEAVLSALPDATLVRDKALALGRFCTSLGLFCGAAKYGALAFAEVTGGVNKALKRKGNCH
jgi:hypothetical protein